LASTLIEQSKVLFVDEGPTPAKVHYSYRWRYHGVNWPKVEDAALLHQEKV